MEYVFLVEAAIGFLMAAGRLGKEGGGLYQVCDHFQKADARFQMARGFLSDSPALLLKAIAFL